MMAIKVGMGKLTLLLLMLPCLGQMALAHPMGNFSISHYAKITVDTKAIDILYLLDFAEIPTYQAVRENGLNALNGDSSLQPYLLKLADETREGIDLEVDGKPLHLVCISRQVVFSEGAGGLPTMKAGFTYRAVLPETTRGTPHLLAYTDHNYAGHSGWKEVVVVGGGKSVTLVSSSAPVTDRSQELTNYPTDLVNSPPQQTQASAEFRLTGANIGDEASRAAQGNTLHQPQATIESSPLLATHSSQTAAVRARQSTPKESLPGDAAVAGSFQPNNIHVATGSLRPNVQATPRTRFTQLISSREKLSFWFLFSAAFLAAGLGALHALEPGHGKTLVAAYLVGSRGKARHAILLGFVVTAAHTAGVYLLGLIALYASRYIVPERLYPWLGAISGLTVTGLGALIFLRHITGQTEEHSHAAGEAHSHWLSSIFKKSAAQPTNVSSQSAVGQPVSLPQLLALGITGGIVPCPAALVVLLSAFSLHRIGFGLFLITAFSLGLAAVLVVVGLAMVYAKGFLSRLGAGGPIQRYLPLFSSAFMVVVGIGIATSAFGSTLGAGLLMVPKDKLLPFVTVILLGLFLGMRHSTDADHVVAVSTIVSKQGSIKGSAMIGALWGLGHTLTIFLVGSAIIIFGVVIPPRVGLAMEFSVALMLILLGVLNLTGVMGRITAHLTPTGSLDALPDCSQKGRLARAIGGLGMYQSLRPFVIGLVHGMAGSAAVALLVLSTIRSSFWATAYLLVFGIGTMAGMMLMTAAMSLPLIYSSKRYLNFGRFITVASGLVSVAFGLFLVYQIGIVNGLFTSQPHWIPS